eukprot:123902-Chlamydomonas_euryale.AAC.1
MPFIATMIELEHGSGSGVEHMIELEHGIGSGVEHGVDDCSDCGRVELRGSVLAQNAKSREYWGSMLGKGAGPVSGCAHSCACAR